MILFGVIAALAQEVRRVLERFAGLASTDTTALHLLGLLRLKVNVQSIADANLVLGARLQGRIQVSGERLVAREDS